MPRAGWLALGAVGAALLAVEVPAAALLALAAGCAATMALAGRLARRGWILWLGIGAALVLARGALGGALSPEAPAPAELVAAPQRTAQVISLGAPGGGVQRAVLELLPPDPPQRVYATLPRYPEVVPGDRVEFDGQVEPAPDEGGFGEFLARSGIDYTVRSRELERLGTQDAPHVGLEQTRRTAADFITRSLPEPQAGLGTALIIGLRDVLARDVADDFRVAGLSHVVAISGWHMALVAGVLTALLSGLSRRRRSVAVITAIAAYTVLAGGAPAVMRAAVMSGVVLLARESGRRGTASVALGLTVLAMLLLEPATVGDVGFQLSVAATAGLLCWAQPLSDRLRRRAPAFLPGWLIETLGVSLAAQAATLPLVLLHFGRLSLVAPLANILAAPVVAPAMLGTAVAMACGGLLAVGVPAVVLAPFNLAGALALGLLITIGEWSAALPFASVELPPPLDVASAGVTAALLLLVLLRGRLRRVPPAPPQPTLTRGRRPEPEKGGRQRRAVAACGLALCMVVVLVSAARPDGRLRMAVLDVGQGDAILLTGPSGGRLLVDTGPDPDRLLTILGQRLPAWDRRIDLVVLTHPHEDHVAGMALLLDRYRIGGVVEQGMVGLGPGDAAFRRRLAELGRGTRIVAAGDRLYLDGIEIAIHWPLPGRVSLRAPSSGKEINNVSLVLDVRFGERRLLLTGDVEEEIDPRLLAAGLAASNGERLDVLKVAHHGSATATTDAFVEHLRPRVAVISAGWGNPYGHPSPRTVERLAEAGARLYRTDLDGTVEISTDGRDLRAAAGGGRPQPTPRPASQLLPGLGFCPLPAQVASRQRAYNRGDGPQPKRRRRAAARAGAARLARAPLRRGGGGGGLPRAAMPVWRAEA
ncbi:MAG TPA: ComEC/Rec2 family competence protein [Candidatus Limnocylindria bacterium]|nr:ComEC/Rec2 family competence protein [Candidatus Limnocylindria bacterium]